MIAEVKSLVPVTVRRPLRHAFDFAEAKVMRSWTARGWMCDITDAVDWVMNRSDPLTPPRKLVWGVGGYLEVGSRFLQLFQSEAKLQPHESVLDVGCGVGRMALPLTQFLSEHARYAGFDIVRANTTWCRRSITPRFPNFLFTHADIFNREYNPKGRLTDQTFHFPYEANSFDFVFLTSVFTHMLPAGVAHYLAEISRVMRPGGRCFATAYLLNSESERLIATDQSRIQLQPNPRQSYWVHNPDVPEACIALQENWLLQTAKDCQLQLVGSPRYGMWSGREKYLDFQDILVFGK